MKSEGATLIPMRIATTILKEIEGMYDEITARAREISQGRAGACAPDLEDWLTAEQQLLSRPEVRVEETDRHVSVTICLGKIRAEDVQLLVTPDAMVIQAESGATAKKVFRTVEFPRRIDVTKAQARYAEGYLILTA